MARKLLRMKRRGWTVLIGAVLVAVLTWQALAMHVAYVGLGPGPTVDVLGKVKDQDNKSVPLITSKNDSADKTDGQLRLVTVRIHDQLELGEALYYWMSDDYAVIPRQLQYPDDKSEDEIADEQNKMWENSQSSAETAALQSMGKPVAVTVSKIDSGSQAASKLKVDDVITKVNGASVTSQQSLKDSVASAYGKSPKEPVKLTLKRDGKERVAKMKAKASSDDTVTLPGIDVKPVQSDPYDLEMHADDLGIGGPSAGLIFALAMVEKASGDDLTGGNVIAGTGEIDEDGNVGPIGGVAQKVVAASQDGASVFLTPADNCAAAKANAPEGLSLLKVNTLDDALLDLQKLRDGDKPQTC